MLASLKKALKWNSAVPESEKKQTSLLLEGFIGMIEEILLWKKMWLSLSFVFLLNIIFFICIHWAINFAELVFCIYATILSMEAFESWLKYKHRISFLKKISASDNGGQLNIVAANTKNWLRRKWVEFVYLRETNHAKAFLLINIFFTIIFIIGKYMSGYVLLYLLSMLLCFFNKIAPPISRFAKKVQQNVESDGELEGLLPEPSETDIKLLSIEPEQPVIDEKQSLDYWKPEDIPLEEASDTSSEHSTSLVTNLSMEKIRSLDRDVDMSDSSEDEYIPLVQQKEQLQSTLEVTQPASSWGSSAYNAFFNMTGAVANMVYSSSDQQKRQRVSSIDSSDGFEIIDKNELN